jgi:lysophospholipase L1-like esterase
MEQKSRPSQKTTIAPGSISGKISKSVLVSALIVVITYAVFEATVTALYLKDVLEPPASVWLYEDSGNTVHFDPIRGYRLTASPSRITRITRGAVEYLGVLKGNNQGFPDRDDFGPSRGSFPGRRIAVFGDSYTAAQYLGENWPDYVEDSTREGAAPAHLLNFAVDGGGLANWWSVLTRLVEREKYDIDGVIFAVIPGNLWRGFSIADHRNQDRPVFGRIPTWNPETFPTTLDEARRYLVPLTSSAYIVNAARFDQALEMKWRPPSGKPLRPYFARKVWQALRGGAPRSQPAAGAPRAFDSFDSWQQWMIRDMARAIKAMNVPAVVIHVPSRENLLELPQDTPPPVDTELFAALLGARLVDGAQAYKRSSEAEIRAMWLPYDAHWGQQGSNLFGDYVGGMLEEWLVTRTPAAFELEDGPPK